MKCVLFIASKLTINKLIKWKEGRNKGNGDSSADKSIFIKLIKITEIWDINPFFFSVLLLCAKYISVMQGLFTLEIMFDNKAHDWCNAIIMGMTSCKDQCWNWHVDTSFITGSVCWVSKQKKKKREQSVINRRENSTVNQYPGPIFALSGCLWCSLCCETGAV